MFQYIQRTKIRTFYENVALLAGRNLFPRWLESGCIADGIIAVLSACGWTGPDNLSRAG